MDDKVFAFQMRLLQKYMLLDMFGTGSLDLLEPQGISKYKAKRGMIKMASNSNSLTLVVSKVELNVTDTICSCLLRKKFSQLNEYALAFEVRPKFNVT